MANEASNTPLFPGVRLIVFDLDGTVVDAFADIAAAANYGLKIVGRGPLDVATVSRYVGHGGRDLMRSCLGVGASEDEINRALEGWRAYYAEHPADFAKPYPSVEPTLAELRRRGIRLAVISNKIHEVARAALQHLGLARYFDVIQGETPDLPRKPDPEALRRLMEQFGVMPEETLMVGDGDADMDAARNAGVAAVGVSYGVSSAARLEELGATLVIDYFAGLLNVLG